MKKKFLESLVCNLVEEIQDGKGSEWDVVLIQPGWSLNGRYYPPDVLKKAVPLFEGLKAASYRFGQKFDHVPEQASQQIPGGFSRNVVGWFENVHYGKFKDRSGKMCEGVLARFHVLDGAEWLRKNLRDAWMHGRPDILGFSIDARGLARAGVAGNKRGQIVERIDQIRETTIVTDPAAGGEVLRLVASAGSPAAAILAIIREARPQWLEGFSEPSEKVDIEAHLLTVLESIIGRAEAVLETAPDSVGTARGLEALKKLLGYVKNGNHDDAEQLITNWLGVNPVQESENEKGLFSFPKPKAKPVRVLAAPLRESYKEGSIMNFAQWLEKKGLVEADLTDEQREKLLAEFKAQQDAEATAAAEALDKREKEIAEREAAVAKTQRDANIAKRVSASALPEKAKAKIEETLCASDGDLSDEDIDKAIEAERTYLADLSESGKVIGLGDAGDDRKKIAEVTEEEREKYGKAWDGFFEGGVAVDGVAPFRSLFQAFRQICGTYLEPEEMTDLIFESLAMALPSNPNRRIEKHHQQITESKGAFGSAALRESVVTGDYPVTFGQALYRRFQKQYSSDPRNDWDEVVSQRENLKDLTNNYTIIRIGGFGELPVVAQGDAYQELTDPTEITETLTPSKKGGLHKLTWEAVLADRMNYIRSIPDRLARAAVLTLHKAVWGLIESNTVIQSNALISSANSNLVSGSPALSSDALADAMQLLRDQVEQDSGEKLGLQAAKLLVGPKLEQEAWEITQSRAKVTSGEDGTVDNFVKAMSIKPVSTIGLGRTSSTDDHWYVIADPKRDAELISVGFLGGREKPDLFVQSPIDTPVVGSAFSADILTFKIRHAWGVALVDWRGIAGSLA